VLLSRLKAEKLGLKLNPSRIKVKAASGDHLRIIGETTVSILIGTRVFRMEVVVGDINYDLVLPSSHFTTFEIDNSRKLAILDTEPVPLLQTGGNVEINLMEATKIAPFESLVVTGRCSVDKNARGVVYVQQASRGFLCDHEVDLIESVVDASTDVQLMLINRSPFELSIPESALLADGHWLEPNGKNFESNELIAIQEHPQLREEARVASELRKKRFKPETSDVYLEVEIGPEVNSDQREKLQNLLARKRTCFSVSDEDIGTINEYCYAVRWRDENKVVYQKPIPPKFALRAQGQEMLDKWVRMDIIEKSASPNNCPLFFIKKKNGKVRPILDARLCNNETLTERWPLPSMHDMLNQISNVISSADGNIWMSVTDISSAYSQLLLTHSSRKKVSFSYGADQYSARRVLFGLNNAPSSFSLLMRNVLVGLENVFCLIDDIIVLSRSFEDHMRTLESIFDRFIAIGLTLSPAKTKIAVSEFEY